MKKEELTIQKSLSVELEKQVKAQLEISDPEGFSAFRKQRGRNKGPADLQIPSGSIISSEAGTDVFEQTMKDIMSYYEEGTEETENMANNFGSMVGSAQNISSILNVGAHTFVGTMLNGLNDVGSILSSIFSIIGAVASFASPAGLAMMALEKGGRLKFGHGGINVTPIPSFASGGSYSTPFYPGPMGGGYPVMVHRNETLDVYNSGLTSKIERMLGEVKNAIMAGTLASTRKRGGGSAPINIMIGKKVLARITQEGLNDLGRSNYNLDEF